VGGLWQFSGLVCVIKDMFAKGTNYLIVGAIAIAIVGTTLPIFSPWKDL